MWRRAKKIAAAVSRRKKAVVVILLVVHFRRAPETDILKCNKNRRPKVLIRTMMCQQGEWVRGKIEQEFYEAVSIAGFYFLKVIRKDSQI